MIGQILLFAKALQISNAEYTLPDVDVASDTSSNSLTLILGGLVLAKIQGWI